MRLSGAKGFPMLNQTELGWEHIQDKYESCGRNVSETARRLGMPRRALQRVFAKRALLQAGIDPCRAFS